ncbi:MAG: Mrp/NBP35 family ATP-binding protein [Planctomycetaceae bacterium]|nr:Mrp/NBP35 family ATP-binding protein [Planctomycetaceae bacterium]
MATAEQVRSLVSQLPAPELNCTLGQARMVKNIAVDDSNVRVEIELPTPAYPNADQIPPAVETAVAPLLTDGQQLNIQVTHTVRGKDTGGRVGLQIHNIIAVGSGKGGVGKSTVAAALACGLHSLGCRVGLMDADVYGPSIPHMMSASGRPAATELEDGQGGTVVRMEPIDVAGLKLMSMGFFIEPGQSVVWRGPMLHKALTQFLKDTQWGELDYLIIDLPPGTGDVSLTLAQHVGLAGAVIVCTPQQVALLDAIKAVDMYRKVNVPVLGFVENMAGPIFGRGGVVKAAAELNVPFLGEVPMEACIREYSDAGQIMQMLTEDNPAREALQNVSRQVAIQVVRELQQQPAGPVLEIL